MSKESEVISHLVTNTTYLVTKVLDLEIKMRVLTELLIESGAANKEEIEKRYDAIEETEFPNQREGLLASINKMSRRDEY